MGPNNVAEVLAEVWLGGALPRTKHSVSPHRARSRLEQINEDFIDDLVTTTAEALLPNGSDGMARNQAFPGP